MTYDKVDMCHLLYLQWLALRFPDAAIYLDTMRECYEAYVIYSFMSYLLAYLWESHPFLERDLMAQPDVRPTFPLCFLKPWNGRQVILIFSSTMNENQCWPLLKMSDG